MYVSRHLLVGCCRGAPLLSGRNVQKIYVGNNPFANIKLFVFKSIPDTRLVFSLVSKCFIYIPKFDIKNDEIICQNIKLWKLIQITSKSATVLTSQ